MFDKMAYSLAVILIFAVFLSGCSSLLENKASGNRSCAEEIGAEKAKALVKTCIFLSPATHPPCHVANSCDLIRKEIKRSCKIIGDIKECKSVE